MMPRDYDILLVGDPQRDPWYKVITESATSLGILQIASEVDALTLIRQQVFDVIVIDASKVRDAPILATLIRIQRPDARILIATTSPTWQRAREAFRAGATDYIRKSLSVEQIKSTLQEVAGKIPPQELK